MMAGLSIASYNCNGFGTDRIKYINELAAKNHFVLLQEHWLLKTQLDKIDSEVLNVCSHSVSGVQCSELIVGRPYGGCSIIWQKDLNAKITPVPFTSSRVCGVSVKMDTILLLLINVYMPVDTTYHQQNALEFGSILHEISSTANSLDIPHIIIGGDFNTDFSRMKSLHTKELSEFMRKESFISWSQNFPNAIDYTCENRASNTFYELDHFLLTANLSSSISKCYVEHSGSNLSDHSAIFMKLSINTTLNEEVIKSQSTKKPLWDNANANDIANYQSLLDQMLDTIELPIETLQCKNLSCNDAVHLKGIDILTTCILNCCTTASSTHIPHTQSSSRKAKEKTIPGWKEHVEPVHQTALFWHFIWTQCGSPRNGEVAAVRRSTRAKYHLAVKQAKRQREIHEANSMAAALSVKDNKSFWRTVQQTNRSQTSLPTTVDDAHGQDNISNLFAQKYEILYNSVSYDSHQMSEILFKIDSLIKSKCCTNSCSSDHTISVDDVVAAICELKKGKHNGSFEYYSDHFINGTNKLNVLLSHLVSSMLTHGHAPEELLLSTIIPITKDKRKSKNDSDNYRGIALSSILGKLIDVIIIKSQVHVLGTSDLQFAYKEGSSTTQCTFVAKEVINYYVTNMSDVYCIFLDASKAFDRVHFVKLFNLLIEKNVCPVIARFLAFLYTNQKCRSRWAGSMSDVFAVSNGVKQGGVLSPLLFNIYFDVLLQNLRDSNVGCYIGNTFTGALAYADDVLLLCPTIGALRKLLSVCETFSVKYNILFNATKSKLITFGNNRTNIEIKMQGKLIPHVSSEIHLGNLIGSEPDILERSVKQATYDMYSRLNLLLRKFSKADCDIRYKLYKLFCVSAYGCQLWDFESPKVCYFFTAWRKAVRRIYELSPRTHSYLIPNICCDKNIDVQIHQRFLRFICNSLNSDNKCVTLSCKLALSGSQSPTCNSINYVCHKYSLDKYNCFNVLCPPIANSVCLNDAGQQKAAAIRDFIMLRKCENVEHLNEILDFLCTS